MKRVFFVVSLLVLSLSSMGQFNFSVGGGASFIENKTTPIFDLEPKFQIADDIRVGLVGKIGLSNSFNSFYGDINVKPINNSNFYFGLGAGWTSFKKALGGTSLSTGGISTESEYSTSFIPSVGFQEVVDINFSAYIGFGHIEYYSMTLSWVIGYKSGE